jgi:activator of 2-hydroxyglutaryl-CoA dehydratase
MKFIGLDAGSISIKFVVLDEGGQLRFKHYERHKGHPLRRAFEHLQQLTRNGQGHTLSITGSAGRLIASILGIAPVNEIVAQAYSTARLFPHIRTIIEMGGEDSKLILLRDRGRSIEDFAMNSVCAAGTGSFLDQQ